MTLTRTLIAGAGAAALLAAPLAATAQGQELPQELSALGLEDVRDHRDGDDDREIRASLGGTAFEVEYDDGRIEEIAAAPGASLPRAVLEALVPAEALSRAADIHELLLIPPGDEVLDRHRVDFGRLVLALESDV